MIVARYLWYKIVLSTYAKPAFFNRGIFQVKGIDCGAIVMIVCKSLSCIYIIHISKRKRSVAYVKTCI